MTINDIFIITVVDLSKNYPYEIRWPSLSVLSCNALKYVFINLRFVIDFQYQEFVNW